MESSTIKDEPKESEDTGSTVSRSSSSHSTCENSITCIPTTPRCPNNDEQESTQTKDDHQEENNVVKLTKNIKVELLEKAGSPSANLFIPNEDSPNPNIVVNDENKAVGRLVEQQLVADIDPHPLDNLASNHFSSPAAHGNLIWENEISFPHPLYAATGIQYLPQPGAVRVPGPGARNNNTSYDNDDDDDDIFSFTGSTNNPTSHGPAALAGTSRTTTTTTTTTTTSHHQLTHFPAVLAPSEGEQLLSAITNSQNNRTRTINHRRIVSIVETTGELIVTATPESEHDSHHNHNHPLNTNHPSNCHGEGRAKTITRTRRNTRIALGVIFLLCVIVILLSLGLAGVFTGTTSTPGLPVINSTTASSTTVSFSTTTTSNSEIRSDRYSANSPTLQKIESEQILRCPYKNLPGFQYVDFDTGEITGINTILCKVVAAALFGPGPIAYGLSDQNEYETVQAVFGSNYSLFQSKYAKMNNTLPRIEFVDFEPRLTGGPGSSNIIPGIPRQLLTNVAMPTYNFTYSLSSPYYYDGASLSGNPFYVECAVDKNFRHIDECQDFKICVNVGFGTGMYNFLRQKLSERKILALNDYSEIYGAFVNGSCNVVMHDGTNRARSIILNELGYEGEFVTADVLFTKYAVNVATIAGDHYWDNFVFAVIESLIVAEQQNITQATAADQLPETNLFGEDYKYMFQNAVGAFGNIGEIYEKYFQFHQPRDSVDRINRGADGLLFSPGLGSDDPIVRDLERLPLGSQLVHILNRGRLLCGVRLERPGFATKMLDGTNNNATVFAGMEIDFCRGIAAALFGGNDDAVDFVELSIPGDPSSDGFPSLVSGKVDVIAGALLNVPNKVNEPTTGVGFRFSQPYFYDYSEAEENLCMATLPNDKDWAAFVYWAVSATIFAEQEGISQSTFNDMPLIYVYGPSLTRMFRDIALAIGSYKDIYERNLESIRPRASIPRNNLNFGVHSGPQLYALPGVI